MEQQGIRLNVQGLTRDGRQDAETSLALLVEHLRYAGIVTDEGGGDFVAWLPKGLSAVGPVQRIHSFGVPASLVTRTA
jgi:hypothetical protein